MPLPAILRPLPHAASLLKGDIDGAAKMIADATASGNSLAVNTAATLAPPAGVTRQLAQAASLAVTKYGANATTVAGALSQVLRLLGWAVRRSGAEQGRHRLKVGTPCCRPSRPPCSAPG